MKLKLDALATGALVVCAIATTSLVVYRHFSSAPASTASPTMREPVFVETWKSARSDGILFGSADAPVQIIEFADFECPYCAGFHETVKTLRARYPNDVAVTYVHYPLQGHRFAIPAARASECADAQGRFEAMHDRLFVDQSSLGLKTWSEYAADADVPNLIEFEACTKATTPLPRVEAGKRLGDRLNVQGTPAVIVNGWHLTRPPTIDELDDMVKAVLAGRSPV